MTVGFGNALAQTLVSNTATIAPPTGIINTNPSGSCTSGLCVSVDTDAVAGTPPLVAKLFAPSSVVVGGTSLLTITMTNTHALTSATLTAPLVDIFPTGIVNAAAPLAQTSCPSGVVSAVAGAGSISLSAGALIPAGGGCTVTVVVTASGTTGALINSIPAGSLTTSLGSNASLTTASLTITPVVDLSLVKVASTSTPSAGGTLSYSLVMRNAGPSTAVGASFADSLPSGLGTLSNVVSAVSGGASTASFTATATGLSGSVTLPANGVVTVTFQVSVEAGATGAITNTAGVSVPPGATDTTPSNNTGTAVVNVVLADVTTVVDLPVNAVAGSVVNVTVTFSNSTAAGATASAVVGTVTLSNGQVQTYTLGNLAPGASAVRNFTTTVPNNLALTSLNATSTVATATAESNNTNNTGTDSLVVLFSDPGVQVNPIPSGTPGSTVTTTVTLSNSGSATVSFTPQIVVNGVTSTLAPITLAPGQTVTSAPISVVLTATGGTVTANVTAPSVLDNNSANNTSTQLSGVILADVTTVVDLPVNAVAGSVVNVTVTFSNSATAGATASAVVGTVTLSNGQVQTYTLGNLAPGASAVRNFTTTVPNNLALTSLNATSTVATATAESNNTNNTGTDSLVVLFSDPGVQVNPIPSGTPGSTVTTTVTLSNSGSATVSFTPQIVVNGVTSTLAPITLAPGQTVTSAPISVVLTATGGTVTANVTAPSVLDNNSANNTSTQLSGVILADVTTVVDLPVNAVAGSVVNVTVTFSNSATAGATASAVVGTVTLSNGQVQTYTLGNLAPGASAVRNFTTTVPNNLALTSLNATSTVATATAESNNTNNTGTDSLVVLFSDPGVQVNPIPSGTPGSTVTTTVTLSNSGSATVSFTPQIVVNGVTSTLAPITLAPGQTVTSAPISVVLTATGGTVTANVTAPSVLDNNSANNTSTQLSGVILADVTTVVDLPVNAVAGSVVNVTVTFSNSATAGATASAVVGTVTLSNGQVQTYTLGNLAPGASAVRNFTTTVPNNLALTSLNATSTVATATAESNNTNNTGTDSLVVLFSDPGVQVNPIPSGTPGSTVTTTVTLSNSGSATVSFTPQIVVNGVTSTLAPITLAPGQTVTSAPISVVLTATGGTVTANVTAPSVLDNNSANNTSTQLSGVILADVTTVVDLPVNAVAGSVVNVTVTFSNSATAGATASAVVGTVTLSNGQVQTYTLGNLAPGASAVRNFTTTVPNNLALTSLNATSTVATATAESNNTNNTGTDSLVVLFSDPGVQVNPIPSGTPGSTVTTTVTLSNSGSATVSFTPQIVVNGVTSTLAPITLAPGQTVTSAPISVVLTATGGTVTANVTAPSVLDNNSANNTSTQLSGVILADVTTVVDLPVNAVAGSVVNVTVTFSNSATAGATASAVVGTVTLSNGQVQTYTLGNLAPGASAVRNFTTTVPNNLALTSLNATSTVATATAESNNTNNTGTDSLVVLFSDPGVQVNPIPSGTPGSTVTTTVTLSNSGSATVSFTPQIVVNGVTSTLAPITLAPGQTVTSAPISVVLTATGGTVTANVTAPSVLDNNSANNTSTQLSGVILADVTTVVDLPVNAVAGSVVNVTVTFSNSATAGATASAVVGTVTLSNGQVQTYTLGNLAPGASAVRNFTTTVPNNLALTSLNATSTVATATAESNNTNNTGTDSLVVLFSDPGVQVNPIPSGTPGSTVTTTVTLSNSGSATVSFTPQIVVNGVTSTLAPITLAPGQTVTSAPISVVLTATGGTVTANVTAPSVLDNNSANNTSTQLSGVILADVTTVVDLPVNAVAGSVVNVTVTFSNSATAGATASAVVGTVTLSNGQVQTYTLGNLAPGASAVRNFTTTVPNNLALTSLNATSTVATATAESNNTNNTGTDSLVVLFSDPGVQVNPIPSGTPGSTVTTTVTLSNSGSATVSFTPQIVVNGVTSTLAPITLAPGQTVTSAPISVVLTATGGTVTANVTAPSVLDNNSANNTSTQLSGVILADVTTVVDLPVNAVAGSVVNVTVTFSNSATAGATASAVVGTVTLSNGQVQTYTLGNLAPGASAVRNFTTTVPNNLALTSLNATSTVATATAESNNTNNTGTDSLVVLFSDPGVQVNPIPSGTPGSTVTTTVTLSNSGSATVSFTPQIVVNGVTSTLAPITLAPGQTVTSAPISVVLTATGGTVTANVTAPSVLDNNSANNTSTQVVVIATTPVVDLSLVKVASTSTPSAGGTLSYSLVMRNAGPSTAVGASFADSLPSGLGTLSNVVSAVSAGASTASFTATATGLSGSVTLPANGVVTVTFQVSVEAGVTGAITNTAGVSVPPGATDTTPSNNTGTAVVTITPVANAVVSGVAYYDVNRDRFLSGGDQPLVGFRVELLSVTGTVTNVVGTATTDANGRYTIADQLPGNNYRVLFRDPTGNTVYGTPFNQATQTQGGQPSTGTNSLTSAISPSQVVPVVGFIDGITLYAGDNTINQNLPLDPSGVIYDALQRTPIAGATVRIVGPSGFDPALHLLGGVANASQLTPAIGAYQFLMLPGAPSGVYSIEVDPPTGYANVPAAQGGVAPPQGLFNVPAGVNAIQAQATPPAQGVTGVGPLGGVGTQYFLQFAFAFPGSGDVLNNHIPLDPLASGAILISKVGSKAVAELGDSVQYTIRIRNTTGAPTPGVRVEDVLPPGFRYILGTARVGNVTIANPDGGVGRNLTFNVGDVAANSTVELTYFVRLGVGSAQGGGINRATAVFAGPGGVVVRSNTAQFKVNVQGGVFSNEGCIVGKVYVDWDGDHMQDNAGGSRELGIPGVRLVMLDGSYVITDSEGKYSICGVRSQTHVIKVDRSTLPRGARMVPSSNRNAGVGDSLFVDLKGGELARADFIEGSRSEDVLNQIKARRAQGGVEAPEAEKGRALKIENNPMEGRQQILPLPRQSGQPSVLPGGIQ